MRQTPRTAIPLLCLAVLLSAGCNNATDRLDAAGDAESASQRVTVDTRSWNEVQELVGEYAGQVVVIDLWTSW